MATLQIRVDDEIKRKVDTLLTGLGLDTPTAVRIFLAAVIDNNGIPFIIQKRRTLPDILPGCVLFFWDFFYSSFP